MSDRPATNPESVQQAASAVSTSPVVGSPVVGSPIVGADREQTPVWRAMRWSLEILPTLAVLATLAVVGYWGHHAGWKIPKFSELTLQDKAQVIDWCEEHSVPEAECISCNADLMPKGTLYGWCEEHGVHECVLHHPELAQLSEAPDLSQADFERAVRAFAVRARKKNDAGCKMHLRRIQFTSKAAVEKTGIDISLVERGRVYETVAVTGKILYDPTRVARLGSRVAGTVRRVHKNVGDRIQKGEVLALVDAADVGKAKAELLDALAQVDFHSKTIARIRPLYEKGIITGSRMLDSETGLQQANIQLRRAEQALNNLGLAVSIDELQKLPDAGRARHIRFLGLSNDIYSQLPTDTTSNNLIPVVASFDGVVTQREAVTGEVIAPSQTLFEIADNSIMWVMLNVPSEDVTLVSVGKKVVFWPDGDDHGHTGELTWMSTEVDAETRTIQVRGEIANEDGHLRNESFGKGEIVLREEDDAIVVPSTAVHWEGCCYVVFVRDVDYMRDASYKVFHTRSVRPGVVMGDRTEMIAGLLPDEVVVSRGSGVLRAELLKGNLGAG